jgi:transcriptional regulator with XRE-family HTH domain
MHLKYYSMNTIIGKNLEQLRDFNRFSQDQVSKFLDISLDTYSCYETGEEEVPLEVLEKISNLYGCDLHILFEENSETMQDLLLCTFRVDTISTSDLHEIAHFKDIVKSYLKINRLQMA